VCHFLCVEGVHWVEHHSGVFLLSTLSLLEFRNQLGRPGDILTSTCINPNAIYYMQSCTFETVQRNGGAMDAKC